MLGARRQEEAEGGKKEAIRRQEGGNNGARRTQEGGNNVRALRGLCRALPGSVDTDSVSMLGTRIPGSHTFQRNHDYMPDGWGQGYS